MSDREDLEKRLKQARGEMGPSAEELQKQKDDENKRVGMQAGMELVAAVVVGVFVGYMLDGQFEPKPLFIIIFFFLGVCTGFYNIYRVTNNLGTSVRLSRLHQDEKGAKTSQTSEKDV